MSTKSDLKVFGTIGLVFAVLGATLIPLALYGGVVYIIVHFVRKFW